jgi:hypothetical protein
MQPTAANQTVTKIQWKGWLSFFSDSNENTSDIHGPARPTDQPAGKVRAAGQFFFNLRKYSAKLIAERRVGCVYKGNYA